MMSKKANKKYVLSILAMSIASMGIATASHAGAYVGGQLGWGNVHQGGFEIGKGSDKDTGLAGRVFGGYQFNPNFAAEMGYTKFHNATAKTSVTNSESIPGGISELNAKGTTKTDAIDLVGKGILPLQKGFSVYGKAGIAYLHESTRVTATATQGGVSGGQTTTTVNQSAHKILPTFGAGVGYEITKNVIADVSWNHIQMVGKRDKLNNTDFIGAGLTYSFG